MCVFSTGNCDVNIKAFSDKNKNPLSSKITQYLDRQPLDKPVVEMWVNRICVAFKPAWQATKKVCKHCKN